MVISQHCPAGCLALPMHGLKYHVPPLQQWFLLWDLWSLEFDSPTSSFCLSCLRIHAAVSAVNLHPSLCQVCQSWKLVDRILWHSWEICQCNPKDPKSDLGHGCFSRQVKWQLEEEEIWSEGPPLGCRDEGAAKRELCHSAHWRCCLQRMSSSWYNLLLVFCPRNSKHSLYFCIPSGRYVWCLENRNIPLSLCVCVLLFHVEMDSVSLRDLKIAYGNVFLLLCSFCSALHLLDFTFSMRRNSHYLFSENNILFLFAGAS